jgi:hypothetical protein
MEIVINRIKKREARALRTLEEYDNYPLGGSRPAGTDQKKSLPPWLRKGTAPKSR